MKAEFSSLQALQAELERHPAFTGAFSFRGRETHNDGVNYGKHCARCFG